MADDTPDDGGQETGDCNVQIEKSVIHQGPRAQQQNERDETTPRRKQNQTFQLSAFPPHKGYKGNNGD